MALAVSRLALVDLSFVSSTDAISTFYETSVNTGLASFLTTSFFNDGISSLFLWLTLVVIGMTIVGSKSVYINRDGFIGNLVALGFLLSWAFSTSNLLVFFFIFEIILIPTYRLIGQWGSRNERRYASYMFFLFSTAGSVLFFITLIVIGKLAGS